MPTSFRPLSPSKELRYGASMISLGIRALRSHWEVLPSPFKLTISLTDRCNARCRTCAIWRRDPRPDLTPGQLDHLLAGAPGASWIDLTGGEILLREDLAEVVEVVVRRSPRLFMLHFPTNGLLTGAVVELTRHLRRLGVPKVILSISLDGPPAVHDRLRGVKGAFERALTTYRTVREEGVEVYLGMTLSRENSVELEATLAELARRIPGFGPRDLHINVAHGAAIYGNPGEELTDSTTVEAVARAVRARPPGWNPVGWLEWLYLYHAQGYLRQRRTPLPCAALRSSCYIDVDGTVYPCTTWGRAVGDGLAPGGLARVWRSPEAEALRGDVKALRCPHCWTPCEAYQSILGAFPAALWRSLGDRP